MDIGEESGLFSLATAVVANDNNDDDNDNMMEVDENGEEDENEPGGYIDREEVEDYIVDEDSNEEGEQDVEEIDEGAGGPVEENTDNVLLKRPKKPVSRYDVLKYLYMPIPLRCFFFIYTAGFCTFRGIEKV